MNQSAAPTAVDPIDYFVSRIRAATPAIIKVDTPIGEFYMRRQSGADRFRMLEVQRGLRDAGHEVIPPGLVVAASLITADGEYVFKDVAEGFKICDGMERRILDVLFNKALEITGIGEKSLEDAEKKSFSGQSSDSGTDSQS